ncbi:MAG: DUF790 family protein [Candidatus Hodarchaeales archaeon]
MVNIKKIPLIRKKNREYYPKFLTNDDNQSVVLAIREFERNVDDHERNLGRENFIEQFDDYKLGLCLYETLSLEFFPFSKIQSQKSLELAQYRLELWEVVNKFYNGVITEEHSRDKVFEKYRALLPQKFHQWDRKAIIDWIFANYSHRQKRVKTSKSLTPEIVRKSVNLQIMRSILRSAQKVEIIIPIHFKLTSNQIKWLFFSSKRFGIFTSINETNDGLSVKIIGPEELIGRRDKYGRKIHLLIEQFFNRRMQDSVMKNWNLKVTVPWGQRSRIVTFDLINLPELPSLETTTDLDFDSITEEKIFHMLSALTPWKVNREPEVLVENNQVFIPDFSLQYADLPSIFIEVVGFWTEDYKTKKIQKLTEFAKTSTFPLILLVDSSLNFPLISPYPSFEYKTDFRLILVPLNNHLREKYLEPYEKDRVENLSKNIVYEIELIFSQKKENQVIFSESSLLENLGIMEKKNLRYLLTREALKEKVKEKGWKYLPKIGLVNLKSARRWRKQIFQLFSEEKRSDIDLNQILPIFPENLSKDIAPRILEYLGFKVHWRQLQSITVTQPSKQQKK